MHHSLLHVYGLGVVGAIMTVVAFTSNEAASGNVLVGNMFLGLQVMFVALNFLRLLAYLADL